MKEEEIRQRVAEAATRIHSKPACPDNIPEDLKPYGVYVSDGGYCVMSIIPAFVDRVPIEDYLIPVPVRYLMYKGYSFAHDYPVVEAEYDGETGLVIPDGFEDFR